jgi:antitoxin MazE
MQIAKWGNSLAVRIPADVARALGLKEGDDLDVRAKGERTLELSRRMTREELVAHMASFKLQLPADGSWKMTREEMNGVDRLR